MPTTLDQFRPKLIPSPPSPRNMQACWFVDWLENHPSACEEILHMHSLPVFLVWVKHHGFQVTVEQLMAELEYRASRPAQQADGRKSRSIIGAIAGWLWSKIDKSSDKVSETETNAVIGVRG